MWVVVGVKLNVLLREVDLMVCIFLSLEFEVKVIDVLYEVEVMEVVMVVFSFLFVVGF